MPSSSRISEQNSHHHGGRHPQKDDGGGGTTKSMLSNSSGGSSTLLMDSVSQQLQQQKRQKKPRIYSSTATSSNGSQSQRQQQQNLRKFTSAIGKPGQARETREAISRVLSAVNSSRPPPLAEPIDYERFIAEKSAQLENDRDRDLLLFFRDDISGSEVFPRERTAVPSVRHRDIEEADWLLVRDALKFHCSPYTIINFNYAKFGGDFKKFDPPQNLNFLRFESDIVLDEEKLHFEQNAANETLREGNLMVLPGDSIVDSFKSEKKRYCILRRTEDGKVYIEVYKQTPSSTSSTQQQLQQLFPPMEIKSAQIKGTKRGKTLQIASLEPDKRTLLLSAENEADLQFWLFDIDRAITLGNKDLITSEDNASLNSSSLREGSVPASQDSESVVSEESIGSRDSSMVWRGKNAAAKALQPPIVERTNLFSLLWDLEPLPEPEGEHTTLAQPLSDTETANAKKTQQITALSHQQMATSKKSISTMSTTSDAISVTSSCREISPDPSSADFLGEKPAILYTAQLRQLDIKTRLSCRETPEQIEPFFLRLFVFDASLGTRLSEEFHMEVPTQRFTELRNNSMLATNKQAALPERIHGISRQRIQNAEKLICTIQNPRPDLYLVAFIERILSDIPNDIYLKQNSAIDAKASVKIQKSLASAFVRLNHLRTLFAWSATPIFPSLCNNRTLSVSTPPNSNIRQCPIYKHEGKLTDLELQKLLNDIQKPERVAKWVCLPAASLTMEADVTSVLSQIPMRISPSLYPLRPWRVPSPGNAPLSPSFELQLFTEHGSIEQNRGFTNLLYVYPLSLNYSTQKTFTRARNIACTVRFVQSKQRRPEKETNLSRTHPIYDRTHPQGPLVQCRTCAVQYHEPAPSFNEEIKLQLPPSLDRHDHLLFTFSHISLANALSGKQQQQQGASNEHFESPIGYSWLPLTRQNSYGLPFLVMSENIQEFELPVSVNLPPNYSNKCLLSNGKEGIQNNNSDLKLVDGGKNLFRVRLRLCSSVFTTEERIQSFFQLCQYAFHGDKMGADLPTPTSSPSLNDMKVANAEKRQIAAFHRNATACSASDLVQDECHSPTHEQSLNIEGELISVVKDLTSVDIDRIIPHLEVILNRIFSIVAQARTVDLAVTSLSAIIKIVDCIYTTRKSKRDLLRNYIRLHFHALVGDGATASAGAGQSDYAAAENETLHGALLKFMPLLKCRENIGMAQVLRQLWFLLDCAAKSMAHWLILSNLIRAPRSNRFPNEIYFCLEELFQWATQQIVERHAELPTETRAAGLALAHFLRYCLSLMDRHQVMKEIYGIVKKLDAVDSRLFRIYKFELLQILAGHEHWIPLCLPVLTDKHGIMMRGDTIIFEGHPQTQSQQTKSGTGGGFFSKLFSHIFSPPYAPHESNEIERCSNTYNEHFYLSETYCSVHFMIGLVFQEFSNSLRESREYRRKIIRLLRNLLVKHCKDQRYGDTSAKNRIAILYLPLLRLIIENIRELEATFKTKSNIQSPPMPSPMMGQKAETSLTNRTEPASGAKLSIPQNDFQSRDRMTSSSSLCKSTLTTTTNSYNSQATANKDTARTAREKTAANSLVVLLAEKLDKLEVRDLLASALYILHNIPKKILAAFWNAQDTIQLSGLPNINKDPTDTVESAASQQQQPSNLLDFIRFLELALLAFCYRGRTYHIMLQAKRSKSSNKANNFDPTFDTYNSFRTGGEFSTLTDFADSFGQCALDEDLSKNGESNSFLMDCHLSQEVALIVLETIQTISNQVAAKTKYSSTKYYDTIFVRLLHLELELLNENWSENVRLQTLAALAVFVNLFSPRFFHSGPLDCLSTLVRALLLQLNSRMARIQSSAAALLQLILRGGFDASTAFTTKLPSSLDMHQLANRTPTTTATSTGNSYYSTFITEKLGRPGAQISVALARLLSEKQLDSFRFGRGLAKLESLVVGDKQQSQSTFVVTSLFERAVTELIKQLKGVLDATKAITNMVNNPIQLADLHIQLANSYRGSAALRSEFFDALANTHISEGWYSEGAVCQAHSLAIIGKELQSKGLLQDLATDWSLLNVLNEQIVVEEGMRDNNSAANTQQAGFTIEDFTRKVECLVRTLILSERYEAIGPIYRLSIPIFEKQLDFKAMVGIYAELQQACSRAAEIKLNGKRHLGSYFKVVFLGKRHFEEEHKTEWIYREPRLTSLAEACDRMVEAVRHALGQDQVRILSSERVDEQQLDPAIAYIQMAYVEPCQPANSSKISSMVDDKTNNDPMCYGAHTNVRTFIQEERLMDQRVAEGEPEMARTALRRLVLTVESPFPNTRRRQRIVRTEEHILSPLELACECLHFKATQIRRILAAADIPTAHSHFGVLDKDTLKRLDLKQLQLFLQGSVSPTVNAGLLAYAEAFTAPAQRQRYGADGIGRLVAAFKTLIAELDDALRVNEAALAGERTEYQGMLRQSFDGMLERLSMFFDGEKFLQKPGEESSNKEGAIVSLGVFGQINRMDGNSAEMHIFDSISGLSG